MIFHLLRAFLREGIPKSALDFPTGFVRSLERYRIILLIFHICFIIYKLSLNFNKAAICSFPNRLP